MKWEKAFLTLEDYISYTELLTSFFTQENYQVPSGIIVLQNGSKTDIARALKKIHFALSEDLRHDEEFHGIVRSLHWFKDLKGEKLYHALLK